MKVAVIGSGMAGLSACWHLAEFAQVDLFEKENSLGIDAHSIDVELGSGGTARVDVPLRVLKAGYYPSLLKLYEQAGINTEIIDYSGSFCDGRGELYFRYKNILWGMNSYSYIANWFALGQKGRSILKDLYRFYRDGKEHLKNSEVLSMRMGDFLQTFNYSEDFAKHFVLPVFAAINTCTYEAVRNYPASVIIAYLVNSRKPSGVRRVIDGVKNVAKKLAYPASQVVLGEAVTGLQQDKDGVVVVTEKARREYDYVVLATQANQAARFSAAGFTEVAAVLSRFSYEPSEVTMHNDRAFLPNKKRGWSPVNFTVDFNYDKPMATIYMNAIQSELADAAPLLQTWNPHRMPAEKHILSHSRFERPLVTLETEAALADLHRLNDHEANRLKVCGSYTETGIPLLEAAALSGKKIAETIFSHTQTGYSPARPA